MVLLPVEIALSAVERLVPAGAGTAGGRRRHYTRGVLPRPNSPQVSAEWEHG